MNGADRVAGVAVVTGAAGGIGTAVVRRLAAEDDLAVVAGWRRVVDTIGSTQN